MEKKLENNRGKYSTVMLKLSSRYIGDKKEKFKAFGDGTRRPKTFRRPIILKGKFLYLSMIIFKNVLVIKKILVQFFALLQGLT